MLLIFVLSLSFIVATGSNVPMFDLEDPDNSGSGSGDISGSGSGGPPGPPPRNESCVKPLNISLPSIPSLTTTDVYNLHYCFSSCLEKDTDATDIQLLMTLRDASLPWTSISQSTLSKNCNLYNKVYECQQGCEYVIANTRLIQSCVEDILEDCTSNLPSYLPDSTCQRICDANSTRRGCNLDHHRVHHPNTTVIEPHEGLTVHEYTSPYLHKHGVYQLHLNASSTSKDQVDDFITTYLIQVEDSEQNIFNYWLLSLSDLLTLDHSLLCETVKIRYVPLNKYSNWTLYSKPVLLTLKRADYPPLPDHPHPSFVKFAQTDDMRHGFYEHGVVNITWETPNNYNFLSSYFIVITTPDTLTCGKTVQFSVRKGENWFVWQAETPLDGPINGCVYSVKIMSVPFIKSYPGDPESLKIGITTTNNLLTDDFSYIVNMSVTTDISSTFGNERKLSFDIQWTLPSFYKLTAGISRFHVTVNDGILLGSGAYNTTGYRYESTIGYTRGMMSYRAVIDDVYTFIFQNNIIVKLDTIYSGGYTGIRYVKEPSIYGMNSAPVPSGPPRNVTLENFDIVENGYLTMTLTWRDPLVLYDKSPNYIVNIGSEELKNSDPLKKPSSIHQIHRHIFQPNTEMGKVDNVWKLITKNVQLENLDILSRTDKTWTIFIQVITNGQANSDWSKPVIITIPSVPLPPLVKPTSTVILIRPSSTSIDISSSVAVDTTITPISPLEELIPVYGAVPIVLALLIAIMVGLIVLIITCIQKKRLNKQSKELDSVEYKAAISDTSDLNPLDLQALLFVGEGTFGPVYRSSLVGKGKNKKLDADVHVMTISSTAGDAQYRRFKMLKDQYKKMSSLGGMENPSLLTYIGSTGLIEGQCMVMEYVGDRDLLSYLHDVKEKLKDDEKYSKVSSGIHVYDELNYFTSSDVFIFSQQISSAMECLSRQGMIHKDLSCRNIYITNAKVLKLTSFGIVKDRPHQEVYYNGEPLRWMAMESILGSSYSSASDVWSFGIVLWELITLGDFPYEHVMNEDLLSFLMSGKRLDIPVGCSNEFFSILQSCWQNDPNRRPTFSHLHKTFLDYFTKKNFDHLIQISSASIKHSCSTDSAIGTSPTIPEVIESSTTNNESITSQRPIDVIIRPSFTNPTFRKDSMDIPDELKIPSGRGKISTTNKSASMSSVVSTNLDSPNKVITKDTPIIYETIPGDNTTEV